MDDKLAYLEVCANTLQHIQYSLTLVIAPQKEYCPQIDSSLFFAIVLDFDLSDSQSYKQLCATLDELKRSAIVEESTTFDPSGSSALQQDAHASEDSSDLARSWHGEIASNSGATEDTDLTSTSQSLERVHLENFLHDQAVEALSDQEKVAALNEMFPEIKAFDIEWALKKVRYSFGKAVEELLNQAFLEEEGVDTGIPLVKRGVEGFSEPNSGVRRKKKKGKKVQTMTDSLTGRTSSCAPYLSRWDRVKEDIDFLEQRTFIQRDTISSRYHKSGASLSATIAALSASNEPDANPYITADMSTVLEKHTIDLVPDFPTLSYAQISALVRLSHPSTTSACELGRALVSSPSSASASEIVPQYLPRPPSPDDISILRPSSASLHLDPSTAAALANSRGVTFTQAQSAFRKSKSNPHFGGAIAYYNQIGRDASASLRKHEAAIADEIVAGQSKPGEVDLHGVNARDAVRISKARVGSWWDYEAQEWSRTGKSKGDLRIVTGQGHHSTGGKGVLGPAVFKALMADGWKVRMEQGYIVVSGRARK